MVFNDLDERLTPPEAKYIFCPDCGGEVYEGELLYLFGTPEQYVCSHCLKKTVAELKAEEIAWLLSLRRKTVKV